MEKLEYFKPVRKIFIKAVREELKSEKLYHIDRKVGMGISKIWQDLNTLAADKE